jgi:uncharacterized protein YjbJ (UPF0337 family)
MQYSDQAIRIIPRQAHSHSGYDRYNPRETAMNKEQVQGRYEEAKGIVKEVTGKVIGNKDLEQGGADQKAAGKVQADAGDLKEHIKKPN